MKSVLFLPIIALSIDVLVEITHKSAVVLETKERDTRSMNPVSGVKTPGNTIFNNSPILLKNTAFTATLSPFLGPRLGGGGVAVFAGAAPERSFINIAATAMAPKMATFGFPCNFDNAPIVVYMIPLLLLEGGKQQRQILSRLNARLMVRP